MTVATTGLRRSLCTFRMSRTGLGVAATVTVVVDAHSGRAQFEQVRHALPGAQSVPGSGDDAFWVPDTSTLQSLRGSSSVVVQIVLSTRAGTRLATRVRTAAVAVARAVIAGL